MWLQIAYFDVKKFLRQPARIIGLTGTPILLWIILGSGFGTSFGLNITNRSINYLQYFFPGTILMQLMFAAIFSTMSLIDDRHNGTLKSMLVSPVSILNISLGKIVGGAILAFIQSIICLLILPFIGIDLSFQILIFTIINLFLIAMFFTSLGFSLSTVFETSQGYHAVMNIFLVPLWLLSGSVFPIQTATPILQTIIKINPFHYAFLLISDLWIGDKSISVGLNIAHILILCLTIIFITVSVIILKRRKI